MKEFMVLSGFKWNANIPLQTTPKEFRKERDEEFCDVLAREMDKKRVEEKQNEKGLHLSTDV